MGYDAIARKALPLECALAPSVLGLASSACRMAGRFARGIPLDGVRPHLAGVPSELIGSDNVWIVGKKLVGSLSAQGGAGMQTDQQLR